MHGFFSSVRRGLLLASLVAPIAACSSSDDEGEGNLKVLLEPEDVITEGLAAGDGDEDIRDGWTVTFDKYMAAVGDVDLDLAADGIEAEAEEVFVVDLKKVPAGGLELWSLSGLKEGRWDVNYSTPAASADSQKHDTVEQADFDSMTSNGWTYFVAGSIAKADGQSCPPAHAREAGRQNTERKQVGQQRLLRGTNRSVQLRCGRAHEVWSV